MVKFEYKNSVNAYKTFMLYTTFVRNRKMLLPIVFGAIGVISLILGCIGYLAFLVIALGAVIIGAVYSLFTYYIVIRTVNKQLSKSKNFEKIKNAYLFSTDDFTVTTFENKKETVNTLGYDKLVLVVQNKNFYYLYVNRNIAFILDSNSVVDGSEEDFKKIIIGATDKKRCKIKV